MAERQELVWEADYGERDRLLDALAPLLDSISKDSWTTIVLYVNNVPYSLEFFLVVGFDPQHSETPTAQARVVEALRGAGAWQRADLTIHDFTAAMAGRRFNAVTLIDSASVEAGRQLFQWRSRAALTAAGFDLSAFGHRPKVFLSHQADRKSSVLDLQARLAARDLPTWMDVFDIDYGQNLAETIEHGVESSAAVIFWVSPGFLQSKFCRFELRSFISNYAARDDVLLLTVVDAEVAPAELPSTLAKLRYLRLDEGQGADKVAEEFGPVLARYFR